MFAELLRYSCSHKMNNLTLYKLFLMNKFLMQCCLYMFNKIFLRVSLTLYKCVVAFQIILLYYQQLENLCQDVSMGVMGHTVIGDRPGEIVEECIGLKISKIQFPYGFQTTPYEKVFGQKSFGLGSTPWPQGPKNFSQLERDIFKEIFKWTCQSHFSTYLHGCNLKHIPYFLCA